MEEELEELGEELRRRGGLAKEVRSLEVRNRELRKRLLKHMVRMGGGSEELVAVLGAVVFISSANACWRANICRLFEIRRECVIQRGCESESIPSVLHSVFREPVLESPISRGEEVPFELCAEGPESLVDAMIQHVKAEEKRVRRIAAVLVGNRQLFAHAKAFGGSPELDAEKLMRRSGENSHSFGFVESDAEETYPFHEEEANESNLVMTNSSKYTTIKCATLDKLIEAITSRKIRDIKMKDVFMLTYHSFSDEFEVLDKLVKRFQIPCPPNLSLKEEQYYEEVISKPTKLNVLATLKIWIREHYPDFDTNHKLRNTMRNYLKTVFSSTPFYERFANSLVTFLNKEEEKSLKRRRFEATMRIPKAFEGDQDEIRAIEDRLDAEDPKMIQHFAEQITWKDFDVFKRIHPRECLHQYWTKPSTAHLAPNVVAVINRYNKINNWVQRLILSAKNHNSRVAAMRRILKIAEHLEKLQNFNALGAIYYGLNSNAVYRLKRVREGLPLKSKEYLTKLSKGIMAPSRKMMRQVLLTAVPPCILYLGLITADLTKIEEGLPDTLNGMIFWEKKCKLAERIQRIKDCQQMPYTFIAPDFMVQKYLERLLSEFEDEETLWQKSLAISP